MTIANVPSMANVPMHGRRCLVIESMQPFRLHFSHFFCKNDFILQTIECKTIATESLTSPFHRPLTTARKGDEWLLTFLRSLFSAGILEYYPNLNPNPNLFSVPEYSREIDTLRYVIHCVNSHRCLPALLCRYEPRRDLSIAVTDTKGFRKPLGHFYEVFTRRYCPWTVRNLQFLHRCARRSARWTPSTDITTECPTECPQMCLS